MNKVYIPHEPSRWDAKAGVYVASMDYSPARQYGELVTCLPPNTSFQMTGPVFTALKEKLSEFDEGDYIVNVGSPLALLLAGYIVLTRTGGKFNLLQWDRIAKQYFVHRVEVKL